MLRTLATISIAASLFGLSLITSCRPSVDKEDIARVDTLLRWTAQADEILNFNDRAIALRADTVKRQYTYITRNWTVVRGTVPYEVQMLMTKYRGMQKNYSNFTRNYPILLFDNAKHAERLAKLRDDVVGGRLGETDLEDYLATEKPLIADHLQRARTLAEGIYGIEPDYHRVSKEATIIYTGLKAECARRGTCEE